MFYNLSTELSWLNFIKMILKEHIKNNVMTPLKPDEDLNLQYDWKMIQRASWKSIHLYMSNATNLLD